MPHVCSTTTGGTFALFAFPFFSSSHKQSLISKRVQRIISGKTFSTERMKQFLLTTPRSCDQKCVFRLDITPRQRDVAVWPHAVAPNSESYFCILRFCNVSLSCTRGAAGKVQSCGSQQHAPHSAPIRPICFSGCWGASI